MEVAGSVSTAAGIISLGITVCQGLLAYYGSWSDAVEDVKRMYTSMESVTRIFLVLKHTLSNPSLEKNAVQRVEESISSCENSISSLQKKLAKIDVDTHRGNWKNKAKAHLQRSLYPFKESTLVKLREICDDLQHQLTLALHALQIDAAVVTMQKLNMVDHQTSEIHRHVRVIGSHAVSTQELVNTLISVHQDDYLSKIWNWLSPLAGDFEGKQFKTFNTSERQDRASQATVASPQFQKWLNVSGETILCVGMPGAGKSILASYIVDYLQRKYEYQDVGIAYIYLIYNESSKQTPANLIASLLQQFLIQKCTVKEDLELLYERHAKYRTQPMMSDYLRLIKSTIRSFTKVYVVIDAIDECPEIGSARAVFLAAMQEIQPYICTFFTSRHVPSIERALNKATKIEMESNDEDIIKYLEQRLLKWESLTVYMKKDATLFETIMTSLIAKARKMFLLARLHVESLMRLITLRKIKTALTSLPESLDKMYDNVIERIQGQDTDCASLAMKVLGWVFYSARPLKVIELQCALAIEPEDPCLDEDGIPDKDLIISSCTGMISVQDGEVISFIHYTAREYFERKATKLLQAAEMEMAQTCLTYLSFSEFAAGCCSDDTTFELRMTQHPFLQYAASFWGLHAKGSHEHNIEQLALEFLTNPSLVASAVQTKVISESKGTVKDLGYSQAFPQISGLGLAASSGLVKLSNILIEKGANVNECDSFGLRALHHAVMAGHADTVQILLDTGADANASIDSKQPALNIEGTPLHLAAHQGHLSIVNILFANNANVNQRATSGQTPLHSAALAGHSSITHLLISHGANPNVLDNYKATPLYRAAEYGREDTVRILLKQDVEIDLHADMGQTPLIRAAENGHLEVTRLLLQHGANWKAKDNLGWTPVYRAMDHGHEAVVRLLKEWAAKKRQLEKETQKAKNN